ADGELDPGMALGEAPHPGRQPAGAEGGGGGDGEDLLAAADVAEGPAQDLEGLGRGGLQALSLPGQRQAPGGPAEEGDAELLPQGADLVADRGLGHIQLLSRLSEAQMPCGGLEDPKRRQRGQAKSHSLLLLINQPRKPHLSRLAGSPKYGSYEAIGASDGTEEEISHVHALLV